jgi:hypothetical protein
MVVGTATIVYAAFQILMSIKVLVMSSQASTHSGSLRKRDDATIYEQQQSDEQVFLPMVSSNRTWLV